MRIPVETQSDVEDVMLRTPEAHRLEHWSKLYSAVPHLSGDLEHAERIRALWASYGIPSKLVRYDVLQNFPIFTSLALHSEHGDVKYQARLKEPELVGDPTSAPSNGFPAFHGFSANGSVCAELVYANFGRLADFQYLESQGISVKDKIVICKYGLVFRGLKVRAAEKFGAAGVIIYSDPQEDGEITAKNGYAHYPEGPARHPESIQRGSVEYFGVWAGDPTTPGYPSLPGDDTERKDPHKAIPTIPSLPCSFADAIPFLQALNGHGLRPSHVSEGQSDWEGALDGIRYFTGPSTVKVSLVNKGKYVYEPIYDAIGTIKGTGDEMIVLGNHHDSWCCGAIDPISGSTSINEVARGLGKLLELGWTPERTIVLASWDSEEYGLLGSTEWGEENKDLLFKNCIAYINVDGATNGGSILRASGSPLLSQVLRQVAKKVPSPVSKKTVYDDWLEYVKTTPAKDRLPGLGNIGTGSDYTVFYDHLGIPCMDMGFGTNSKAVYPYHSNYDSFTFVEKFADPGFVRHLGTTRLFGMLAVRLAGAKVLPYLASEYTSELKRHTSALKSSAGSCLDFGVMEKSIEKLEAAAKALDTEAQTLQQQVDDVDLGYQEFLADLVSLQIADVNKRYMSIEKAFLNKAGLPGRPWFKHIIYAPGLWKGYEGVVFPGILEALETGEVGKAQEWVGIIAKAIETLSETL
ncbi:Zn-dependent exopeptidase-1 [Coleophoma crateriformis]|uniref:Zn-dependent exopeptidase-1 n=1 Tax=Coleophoma crateriformis TaxID=565419 RepID=A0A3D8S413_9HELO|nr:Zn-dependent exopeptidase-1 [Coleophoma crateriformis]